MPKIKMIGSKKSEAAGTEIPKAPLYALAANKGEALNTAVFVSNLKSIGELSGLDFGAVTFGELRPRSSKDISRLKKAAKDAGIRFYDNNFGVSGESVSIRTITVFPVMEIPGKISETGYKLAIIAGDVIPFSDAGTYMCKWAEENGFDYARTWFRDKR